MKKRLTSKEREKYTEMVSTFGGVELVDTKKVRRRILAQRKRKTNRVTRRDMEDMFGY